MPESRQVTITNVEADPNEWTGKHGSFIDYALNFNDGTEEQFGIWTRKADADPPQEGYTGWFDLTPKTSKKGNTYYKLTLGSAPDGRSNGSGPTSNYKGGGMTPDREARIVRQHSQEMAIRLMAAHGNAGAKSLQSLMATCRELADEFDADVAAKAASIPQSHTPPPSENGGAGTGQPSQSTADPSRLVAIASNLEDKLVKLALSAAGAKDVSDIPKAIAALSPTDAKTFEDNLEALGAQVDQGVEHPVAVGAADPDDDIPF